MIDLNFYSSLDDRLFLKGIFKLLFQENDRLFFSFRREENLTDDNELLQLRKTLPSEFIRQGNYLVIRKLDEERFDSIGSINYTYQTSSFLLDVWKYFYAFTVFIPSNNITWSDYVDYVTREGFDDIDGKKLLNNGLAKFILIKGLGGEYLNISYIKDFDIPNFNSIS